jgi:hypothetical protein
MTISVQHAQAQLDLYLEAERDILSCGQSTRVGDRVLSHADLIEVRNGITYWMQLVGRLSGRRRMRLRSIIPTD